MWLSRKRHRNGVNGSENSKGQIFSLQAKKLICVSIQDSIGVGDRMFLGMQVFDFAQI